jgi:DNA-binding NtrC family response regulator
MASKILVVDDQSDITVAFARMLRSEGYEVDTASSGPEADERLRHETYDLLLTDVSMPKMSGLDLLEAMRQRGDATPTIVVSGAATINDAVRATKLGAIDFVEKPIQRERLALSVGNALRLNQLQDVQSRHQEDLGVGAELVGSGATMMALRALLSRIGPSDGRVLIIGANGTGKELVAAAIHASSPRRAGPFVKLNCGAVARELVESELFGHEKGSFTGAIASRRGRFELAHGGTLLLDEIGDMPMPMQVKLLRVLQEGTFERVGGGRTLRVNVRVLAATNRDLSAMVANGEFREDLYYRLNVVTVRVPALCQRREDIPELVDHFVASQLRVSGLRLTGAAKEALKEYDYPGNVRELQNVVERLRILYGEGPVEVDQVRAVLRPETVARRADPGTLYRPGSSLRELLRDVERRVMVEAIAAHGNSKLAAAEALGSERSHFYKKCRQYGIGDADEDRPKA